MVEDKITGFDATIQEYIKNIGIGLNHNSKAGEYLNMTQDEINKLSSEDCNERSFILAQYSAYIQQVINKHKAIVGWADRNIMSIVAKNIMGYGTQYTPYEAKKMMAIMENPSAKELFVVKSHAENNISILQEMPRRIDLIVQTLKDLSMVRRKQ